jgi:Domain of unknown function (DUF4105)
MMPEGGWLLVVGCWLSAQCRRGARLFRQLTTDNQQPAPLIALLFALAIATNIAAAEEAPQPGANLDVALLTFGPGAEVWERFGHNAIQIRDRASGVANLYNYGIFDFDQEDFFLNFARGYMTYRMAVSDPAGDLPMYREEGRWIVEQDLNLTPAQRVRLATFLDWNARPENSQYRYEYFTANCSTRVRDALDAAVDGAIRAQTIAPSRGFTYRMDTLRLMRAEPVLMVAMDAGLGPFADKRLTYWDESFVPMELMRHLREVRVPDESGHLQPLVANETWLATARLADPPEFASAWVWQALAIGIASALAMLGLWRLRTYAWARAVFATIATSSAFVLGLGGVVLIALWTLTEHISAWRNENILLLNPLCLLLLPAWIGSFRARWRPTVFAQRLSIAIAVLACLAFFVKVFPAFAQDNRFWIALLLPLHVAMAIVLGARYAGTR